MVQVCIEKNVEKNPYGLIRTDQKAKHRRSQIHADLQKSSKQLLELIKEIREQEINRLELEEIRKMREQMEFKANPVRHFRQFTVHPSTAPLTVPISPNLHTEKRFRTRSLQHSMKLFD
ncbi:targeting for Xklp2 -like protein [Brachionus plicatilis]|uniref:Targeting for Xklp2-like protein n=1 Tax=Brachionus plicatilis TaxID=10195 RepID=A0A3M7P280_BRAPC|nr:targeting for Xklp2 -like protein [Brachionus plicatilis]